MISTRLYPPQIMRVMSALRAELSREKSVAPQYESTPTAGELLAYVNLC